MIDTNEDLSINYHDLTIEPQSGEYNAEEETETSEPEVNERECSIMEGLLFITGDDGLTAAKAAEAMEISVELAEAVLHVIMENYRTQSHGFEIEHYGDTYRFLSKAIVHDSARRLFQIEKEARLSNAAMETLAIIAYKQPITRVEIEKIRGVSCDHAVNKLVEYGLVYESGRLNAPGRPMLFSTTEEFLRRFQVDSLEHLPELDPEKLMELQEEVAGETGFFAEEASDEGKKENGTAEEPVTVEV